MKRTLNKGYQFRRVFRTGKTFRGESFRAVYVSNTLGFIRLGFSLSAKSGNAVSRNLMRRRVRSLAREESVGIDLVILPEGKLRGIGWDSVKRDFEKMMDLVMNNVSKKNDESDDNGER
ncbi:MAG: ribonuclease P protein component [Candidatus Fermentibacteraceae bacterium]|nr:ribonuclease P protein component [Candidatus Fermentibacteraceae bacterium]MBN2609640.1 ribonuclease P protein component [Candidatus Fermentibacteraceae bacterium]